MSLKINPKITNIPVTFSPSYYKMAKNAYMNGNYRYILALIDRAEEDSFISGCLIARHAGYKRKFTITPASSSAADQRAAEILAVTLANLNARELFEDMIDARLKWYSVIALEWEIVNGMQIPVYAEKVNQKYFRYDKKDNTLKLDFGNQLKNVPKDSALILEYNRKPIMLSVLKDYIRKEMGEHNWASFLETFGEPFIIGKYPPGQSTEFKDELEAGINKMAQSTRGIAPIGSDIQIIETRRNTADHQQFINDCKEGISMALLGHKEAAGSDKTMQIGDSTSGIQVKKDLAIDDMFWLEEQLKHLTRMVINRNATVTQYPVLTIDKSDNIDLKIKLQAAELGLQNGAAIDASFLSEFGIPVTNPEEPLKHTDLINLGV